MYTHIFIQRGNSLSDLVPNSALPEDAAPKGFSTQSYTLGLAEEQSQVQVKIAWDWDSKFCQTIKLGPFLQVLDCAITLYIYIHIYKIIIFNKNLGLRLQSKANQRYAGLWTQMAHLHGSWNTGAFADSLGKADLFA